MHYSRHGLTASVAYVITALCSRTRQPMTNKLALLAHWSVHQKLNLSVQFSSVRSLCTCLKTDLGGKSLLLSCSDPCLLPLACSRSSGWLTARLYESLLSPVAAPSTRPLLLSSEDVAYLEFRLTACPAAPAAAARVRSVELLAASLPPEAQRLKGRVQLFMGNPSVAELQCVTCHMGSQNVTCHPT